MGTTTGVQSVDNAIITMGLVFSDIYMYNLYNSINDLWLKHIFDLIKTLKTITTLLKVSQIFELHLLALLQGKI